MKRIYLTLALFSFIATTQVLNIASRNDDPSLMATLWVQNSAEYEAITLQTYKQAEAKLAEALEDSSWTASVEQHSGFSKLPPAIVLDIDETVLDNSYYQARLILDNDSFSEESWADWVYESNATAIKGAVKFTKMADSLGIRVFYVSNRDANLMSDTIDNLKMHGFPMHDKIHTVLLKGERATWTSSKVNRRKWVVARYRILMMVGDDLNDFLPAKEHSPTARKQMIEDYESFIGTRWFVLPNPVYGSWERTLNLTEKQDLKAVNAQGIYRFLNPLR